jgi:hypothetical protein
MGTAHSCMVDKSGGKGKWTDLLLKNKCLTFFGVSVVFLFFIVIIFLVEILSPPKGGSSGSCKRPSFDDTKDIKNSLISDFDGMDFDDIQNMNADIEETELQDVYIASSYNTCRAGGGNTDLVDIFPIEHALKRGARLLDFEIYYIDGKAAVAASDKSNYKMKSTTNCIPIGVVLEHVDNLAFNPSVVSNPSDPLFLNFRIKSKDPSIGELLFDAIDKNLDSNRLLAKISNRNGDTLLETKMGEFKGKIIIICNNLEPSTTESTQNAARGNIGDKYLRHELINLSDNTSTRIRKKRFTQVTEMSDIDAFTDKNRNGVCLVFPDLFNCCKNMNHNTPASYGCQMIAMNYQTMDANLENYFGWFLSSSFKIKPEGLRSIPNAIEIDLRDHDAVAAWSQTRCSPTVADGVGSPTCITLR